VAETYLQLLCNKITFINPSALAGFFKNIIHLINVCNMHHAKLIFEDSSLAECYAVLTCKLLPMFRGIVVPSRSGHGVQEEITKKKLLTTFQTYQQTPHNVPHYLNLQQHNSEDLIRLFLKLIFVNISIMLREVRTCCSLIVSPFQHTALPCPDGSKRVSVARQRAE